MKLIVAGATGFIGSEVLRQCIASPGVTSILVVSRREPAKELMASPKVKVILHEDFSEWPTSLLEQLEGAEGCIWYLNVNWGLSVSLTLLQKDCWRKSHRFPRY